MKKIVTIFLCSLLILSILLTGCGNNCVKSTNNEEKINEDTAIITAPGTYPIVKDGKEITLSITVGTNVEVDDYDNNEFTKWFETKTGVDFEFTVLPRTDKRQKLSLMMSSGDYTDVIMCGESFSLAEQQLYASQGLLISLDDLIDKYGVETKKAFEQFPNYNIKDIFSLLDGKIYTLPILCECYHCQVVSKMWIYKPWLDTLGLKMPTTTEEFYNVLKAFKEQDPNGNNQHDEIPLAGSPKGWHSNVDTFLMNAFISDDGQKRLVLDNGKIDVTFNKPGWKEGLQYLKKLYDEKLIAPESYTQNKDQLNLLAENAEIQILGAAPGGSMPGQIMGESGRWKNYKAVPALKGPDGVQEVAYYPSICGNDGTYFITDKCKYPEIAFRVGDALYNDEISYRADNGVFNQDWRWAKQGELGIDGNQGITKQLISNQELEKNITWHQQAPKKRTLKDRLGRVIEDNPLEKILYQESHDKYYPYLDNINTTTVPDLIFSEEQSTELVDLESTIDEYVNEMIARFVTGDVDLDSGWTNYLDELQIMNLNRYLEIYQNAYDTKYKD